MNTIVHEILKLKISNGGNGRLQYMSTLSVVMAYLTKTQMVAQALLNMKTGKWLTGQNNHEKIQTVNHGTSIRVTIVHSGSTQPFLYAPFRDFFVVDGSIHRYVNLCIYP